MALPQLILRKKNMHDIPPLALPEGFALHSHIEGQEKNWEDLIEAAFGSRFSFDACIRNGGGYKPEYVLYISKNGVDIATTTAVEKETFPGEGWFRMVGTHPSARGQGTGKMVMIAALHSLAARGYKSTVLSTDDSRLSAISLYLALGFEPVYLHESHQERWEKVFAELKCREDAKKAKEQQNG